MNLTIHQKNLSKFAYSSTSNVRPAIAAVKTNGVTAVATNQFMLVELTNIARHAPEDELPIMLNARSLSALKFKKEVSLIRENNRLFTQEAGVPCGIVIESASTPDEFPQYEQLFPTTEPVGTVVLNAKYLADIATALAKLDEHSKITINFHAPLKPLVITAKGSGHSARALLMPIVK